ncbi:ABC transporter ATP-binding protein [Brachybacterium huguangmaarense]|uniref:ABC transporter ATP-binding protein n=1 Tax=Brachybacterium huguangmaarense TaxID=1652028 RepID=A0ABY6G2F8_9MICO|nr:ABC transporter ATP-binding protein [Brachybacterium huguangmaarense]UYG17384.1 ABC transporter ATP-binding protein [Brachybacterium huguangmaarense]
MTTTQSTPEGTGSRPGAAGEPGRSRRATGAGIGRADAAARTSSAGRPRDTRPVTDEAAVISASGLERRYGSHRHGHLAVAGIDLEIRRGELFALLGTNGAGKTSTLEVLEGLARPTGGSVRVFGADPYRDRGTVRPRQGLMLQSGGFPADLTAREALRMWCATLSTPRPLDAVLEEVDLSHRASTRISALSGGEVRRLDLACAVAGGPELLFLDEPTTGLDPESRTRTQELIARLRARGTTIVLTTHYLDEAEALADRIAIMHRGRIVRRGALAEVIAGHPAHLRFRLATGLAELPSLTGDVAIDGRDRIVVTTTALQDDLGRLLDWARSRGVALLDLDARAPSLESVFLSIAGSETYAPALTEGASA